MTTELEQRLLDAAAKLRAMAAENAELMEKVKAKAATKEIGPDGEFIDKEFSNGIKELIEDTKKLSDEIAAFLPL